MNICECFVNKTNSVSPQKKLLHNVNNMFSPIHTLSKSPAVHPTENPTEYQLLTTLYCQWASIQSLRRINLTLVPLDSLRTRKYKLWRINSNLLTTRKCNMQKHTNSQDININRTMGCKGHVLEVFTVANLF